MAIDIDPAQAREALADAFAAVQRLILEGVAPPITDELMPDFDAIFSTNINSYREALLGCVLARLQNQTVNVRLPYVNQGANAFSGRTLDETVVNPFLQTHRIPCSGGPYLAMFRRDFRFDASKREGQRSKPTFDAFLHIVDALELTTSETEIRSLLVYLLYRFAKLREAAEVPLARLQRISLEQYESLLGSLLNTPSGGRLPVILVVAAFHTIKDYFALDWTVGYQGINVADIRSGVGGDITISKDGHTIFAAEVTERPMERSRVISTFNTKIAPLGIEDYLFFVRLETLSEDAREQARHYFAQGHEVNFLEIRTWILMLLASMGKRGREIFSEKLLGLIGDAAVPRSLKVAWNDCIAALTSVS
jgi:SacI restriction endonuclease